MDAFLLMRRMPTSNILLFAFRGILKAHGSRNYATSNDLSDKNFWELFYSTHSPNNSGFDWFLGFNDVKEHFARFLTPIEQESNVPRILDLGCGTSNFSVDLFRFLQGKCYIDCVDYSESAIKIMNQRIEILKNREINPLIGDGEISFHLADVRNLPFKDKMFKVSIDKGTSDAVLRSLNGEDDFIQLIKEVMRVLRDDGTVLQFSDEGPESRLDLLSRVNQRLKPSFGIDIHYKELGGFQSLEYFMYVIQKI